LASGTDGGRAGLAAGRNETIASPGGSGQPGPITLSYALKHAPVLVGDATLAGDPKAVHTVSGSVYDGTTLVASFTAGPDGRLALTPAGNLPASAPAVTAGFLSFGTGLLALAW